ncbi:ribokinase [Metabacillus sp. GX 13764]|uniref:ribokinase n=1 Tax=Metabacillus kandeliae TaxID=2900151 RepID=UPI001E62D9C8|nr:ribokinase [Metabacillus kandeliae]MCD7034137.1 ribokinase [Metabacillus kandeliae]
MAKITVIGSASIDLVVEAKRRPAIGETIMGESFKTVPGGKGANQAVAAARLGADVTMIGCIGDDAFGEQILSNLKANGVNTEYMEQIQQMESGTAHITLAEGDNSIIVVKGANQFVLPSLVEKALPILRKSQMVLIQQEIPEETVEYVSEICSTYSIPLLLNPAPARPVSKKVLQQAAYLTPNESEAAVLFGEAGISEAFKQYPNKLLVTEGSNGVRFYNGSEEIVVPGYKVEVVDTTGAGDTFNAGFAVAMSEGMRLEESIRFANRAASLSVTKFGAQGGMPIREEVEKKL